MISRVRDLKFAVRRADTANVHDDPACPRNDVVEHRSSRRGALAGLGAMALATACRPDASGPAAGSPGASTGGASAGGAGPPVPAPTVAPGAPPSGAVPSGAPATTVPPTAPPTTAVPPTTAPPHGDVPAPTHVSAALLIDKLTFGPRPGLRAAIERQGIGSWIEDQLDPVGRNVPDAEARVADYVTLTNTHHANYHLRMQPGAEARFFAELDYATIQRAVFSERQLYELLCDFWSNHFNIWRQKNWATHLFSRSSETVIRPHALGRFADMLRASAHDSAMANYLDNHRSSGRDGIIENYARELMELHTLGIHDGEHVYTEADVRSVAKLFSG
ncbi:MAG: DUF1800 domain-containing protein, partial [Actinobacteria bacterium]|nr:DUF1800 domain-containing protein [Actinomycetota bacterium]